MITVETLSNCGANTKEGIERCMNNEEFYIMLVNKALSDDKLNKLKQQLLDKDLDAAFETAHALKGMYSNLSLDPLTKPISEMTELLRSRCDVDYGEYMAEAEKQFAALTAL